MARKEDGYATNAEKLSNLKITQYEFCDALVRGRGFVDPYIRAAIHGLIFSKTLQIL